jgi:hypothetical protein
VNDELNVIWNQAASFRKVYRRNIQHFFDKGPQNTYSGGRWAPGVKTAMSGVPNRITYCVIGVVHTVMNVLWRPTARHNVTGPDLDNPVLWGQRKTHKTLRDSNRSLTQYNSVGNNFTGVASIAPNGTLILLYLCS